MEPTSFALAAIALTAIINKTVDALGDGAIAAGKQLLTVLTRKSPDTVKRLEAAAAQGTGPESAAGEPAVIDVEILEEEIRQVAEKDPEVQAAVQTAATAMQQQFSGVINQGKLAEKIGFVFQGGNNTVKIEKLEF